MWLVYDVGVCVLQNFVGMYVLLKEKICAAQRKNMCGSRMINDVSMEIFFLPVTKKMIYLPLVENYCCKCPCSSFEMASMTFFQPYSASLQALQLCVFLI
jgi:hypothetical protein